MDVQWALPPASAATLASAIAQGAFPLHIRAAFVIRAVAPRSATVVEFNPHDLVGALRSPDAAPARPDAVAEQLARLGCDPILLPRLVQRFGRLTASANGDVAVIWNPPDLVEGGSFRWDLSEAVVVDHLHTAELRAFDAVAGDLTSVLRVRTIAELPTGEHQVLVGYTGEARFSGVHSVGVRFESVPPAGRRRPVARDAVVVEPGVAGRADLRLGALEPFHATATTFAVVRRGLGHDELRGEPYEITRQSIWLGPSSFPVTVHTVTCEDALLENGSPTIAVRHGNTEFTVELSGSTPDARVALPDAVDATFQVTLRSADGQRQLALDTMVAGRLHLDRTMFAEFGHHQIDVVVDTETARDMATIELAPEATPDDIHRLSLSAFSPKGSVHYVALDPLRAGYRFRVDGGEWSAVRSPFEPVTVTASPRSVEQ